MTMQSNASVWPEFNKKLSTLVQINMEFRQKNSKRCYWQLYAMSSTFFAAPVTSARRGDPMWTHPGFPTSVNAKA